MRARGTLGILIGLMSLAAARSPVLAQDGRSASRTPQIAASKNQDVSQRPVPQGKRVSHGNGEVTRCAACHGVEGWDKVRFNHDPTGFPLRGAHVGVACGSCHPKGFGVPVANTCAGCHRDRHRGEFGVNCEGCHDSESWRPFFNADAHRRTGFPLVGQHALIPCQQCHGDMRDRTFTRAPSGCVECHRADYERTSTKSVNHSAAGFSFDCQSCHTTWRFWPARFEAHRSCFPLSGPHSGIRCLSCHTSLSSVTTSGACSTGTASCTSCHTHSCARSDHEHREVMGYQCADMKCYECHKANGK